MSPREIRINCNLDSLLVRVSGEGPVISPVLGKPDFSPDTDELARAIVVDTINAVLMDAYMNAQAYDSTNQIDPACGCKRAVYYSRSRKKLWPKGEQSGNIQRVLNCQTLNGRKAIQLTVDQLGDAACHDGFRSCFYRILTSDGTLQTVEKRLVDPAALYPGTAIDTSKPIE